MCVCVCVCVRERERERGEGEREEDKFFFIFVVPCIMLYSSEISPTRCNNCVFILRNGFTLRVSGDNLTHHQEYNAVYGHR